MSELEVIEFNSGPPSNFFDTDGFLVEVPYGIKSFSPAWISVQSTERIFQAMKAYYATQESNKLFWEIVLARNNSEAKRMGRLVRFTEDELAAWNGTWALETMLRSNIAKFTQVEECREWLLNTGDAHLVEHRPDPIWGDNIDGSGKNLLGKTLEVVRALIR